MIQLRQRIVATAVAASVLALCAPVAAQRPDSTATPLDTLRIEVLRSTTSLERASAAVTILADSALLQARPAIGLHEVLGAVPGVHVANRENLALGSRLTVRGFGSRAAFGVRGVRVVADGIPLTMPDGQTNLNNLDLARAARIEVLRGPVSTLYGNASGGVIRVESAPPAARPTAEVRLLAGDEGSRSLGALRRIDAQVSGPVASGGYAVAASHLDRDGWRDHSAASQSLLNARLTLEPRAGQQLRFVVNGAHTPFAENPGSLPRDSAVQRPQMAWPDNVAQGTGEEVRQLLVGGSWTLPVGGGRLESSLWGAARALENPIPVSWIDLTRRAGGARVQFDRSIHASVDLTAGAEVEGQRDRRLEFDNAGGMQGTTRLRDQVDGVATVAPFAMVRGTFRTITLSAGARYDRIRLSTDDRLVEDGDDSGARTLTALSPSLGVVWLPMAGLSTFANYTTGFQTPTTNELANAPPAPGAPCCPGGFNDALAPERTAGGEIGMRWHADRVRVEAAAFRYDVRNAIVAFQVEGIEERSFFRNAGRTRHQGVEVGMSARVAEPLDVRAAFTRLDAHFLDDGIDDAAFEGNQLPGVPGTQLHLGASFERATVTAAIDVQHVGDYFADDANSDAAHVDASTWADVRVTARVAAGRLALEPFIALQNVTDQATIGSVVINAFGGRFFEPGPARTLLVGLTARNRGK